MYLVAPHRLLSLPSKGFLRGLVSWALECAGSVAVAR